MLVSALALAVMSVLQAAAALVNRAAMPTKQAKSVSKTRHVQPPFRHEKTGSEILFTTSPVINGRMEGAKNYTLLGHSRIYTETLCHGITSEDLLLFY